MTHSIIARLARRHGTTVDAITRREMLKATLAASAVHIAGEHACYKFVGYMEGALNSGVRVARRIAERDGVVQRH